MFYSCMYICEKFYNMKIENILYFQMLMNEPVSKIDKDNHDKLKRKNYTTFFDHNIGKLEKKQTTEVFTSQD